MARPGLGLVLVALSLLAALAATQFRLDTLTDKDALGYTNPRVYDVRQHNSDNDEVLIADYNRHCIFRYSAKTGARTTYAGVCGQYGSTTTTGLLSNRMSNPTAFDHHNGRLIVADRTNRIRLLSDTEDARVLASNVFTHSVQVYGNNLYYYNFGDQFVHYANLDTYSVAQFARVNYPHAYGMHVDEGKIWYTSFHRRVVASIDLSSKQQVIVCGRNGVSGQQTGGCGTGSTDSTFTTPWGIVRANGEIFVAEYTTSSPRIVAIRTNTKTGALYTSTFVRGGSGQDTLASGTLPGTLVGSTHGLSVSVDKTKVFIAQYVSGAVRRLEIAEPTPEPPTPEPLATFAPMFRTLVQQNDAYEGSTKRFIFGQQVQEINADEIVVADRNSNCIAKYTLSTGVLSEYDSIFCNSAPSPISLFVRHDSKGNRFATVGSTSSSIGVRTFRGPTVQHSFGMNTPVSIRYFNEYVYVLSFSERRIVRFDGHRFGSMTTFFADGQNRYAFDISVRGNIFATNSNGLIERITTGTPQKSTFCGRLGYGFNDGACSDPQTSFYRPWGIAVATSDEVVYVGDYDTRRLRKIEAGVVTTLTAGGSSLADVPVTSAQTGRITHISVSADERQLYMTQENPVAVRVMELEGKLVPTPEPTPAPAPEEPCGASCLRGVCVAGETLELLIEGATTPNVWGTGKYSDDSDVGSAAVHAGMVAAGERATLKIKCFGAVASFTGTTKNGVTSQDWSASVPSFGFIGDETIGETPEPPSAPSRPDTCYGDQCVRGRCNVAGKRFQMVVTGKTTGAAYGTEVYTDDSSVALAAVHIGLLDAGKTGIVEVQCVRGRSSYPGTTANGVTTTAYPFPWNFAFTLRNGPALPPPPAIDTCSKCLRFLCRDASKSAVLTVHGSSFNRIWGDDVFSGDSDPNVAAVHAGLVQVGEEKIVKAQCRGSQSSFSGSIRNGVRSRSFSAPYDSSYELAAFDIEQASATTCVGACLTSKCELPGSMFKIRVTGDVNQYRLLWGYGDDDEPFTSDSDVQAAAVMSGLVAEGETADLQVKCSGPRDSFGCRTKNGVQSECYTQSWGSSFQFTRR